MTPWSAWAPQARGSRRSSPGTQRGALGLGDPIRWTRADASRGRFSEGNQGERRFSERAGFPLRGFDSRRLHAQSSPCPRPHSFRRLKSEERARPSSFAARSLWWLQRRNVLSISCRYTTLRSSRTLPGQACCCSRASAPGVS